MPTRLAPPVRLVLFPGLGVDGGVYAPQHAGLPFPIECPSWIDPQSDRETLAHYAMRMAARVRPPMPGEVLYLGGISLGAMVALEAAAHIDRVAGVIMIGGCRSGRDLSPLFRGGVASTSAFPRQWIRPFLGVLGPVGFDLFERLPMPLRDLMLSMMLAEPPRRIRWSALAIRGWAYRGTPPCPVYTIQGGEDEVIPPANVHPDRIVPGGRHLINLSHPREVNRFILKCMNLDGVGASSPNSVFPFSGPARGAFDRERADFA